MSSLTANDHAIIVCEGTFEQVAIEKLNEAGRLVVPSENIIDVTRTRTAKRIQEEYLQVSYDWRVSILRILDSRRERFELGILYRDRYPVLNIITHPEIEMLLLIHEGCYDDYQKFSSQMKPSEYCVQNLGYRGVKSRTFLESYWDADSLADAISEYRKLSRIKRDELCLMDILR